MYIVMILLLICRLICVTIPGAHIRCMHSILSFNWSVIAGSPTTSFTVASAFLAHWLSSRWALLVIVCVCAGGRHRPRRPSGPRWPGQLREVAGRAGVVGRPGIWFRVFIFVFLVLFSHICMLFYKFQISRIVDPFAVIQSLLGFV
jgi:hypothetical protein